MEKKKNQNLETILKQKEVPSAVELVKKMSIDSETSQEMIRQLQHLDDEREKKIIIGKKALEVGDLHTALFALSSAEFKDDKVYSELGDRFVDYAEKMFHEDPFIYEGGYFNAEIAYNQIKDENLRKQKHNEAAKKVLAMSERYVLGKFRFYKDAAGFYHYAREDMKLVELGDEALNAALKTTDRYLFPNVIFNDTMIIYGLINDKELFEKKVRMTLYRLMEQKYINFEWVGKCLIASRMGKEDEIGWDKDTLAKISELHYSKSPKDNILGYLIPEAKELTDSELEALADEVFEHEIKKPNKEIDLVFGKKEEKRELQQAKSLYRKIKRKLSAEKLRKLGKRAEKKKEFSFAMWAYKELNSEKDMDRIVKKAIEDGQFKELLYILDERATHNNKGLVYDEIRQKGLLDGFNKAFEKNKVSDAYFLTMHLMPELVRDKLLQIGDSKLEKAENNGDYDYVQDIYKKAEHTLTAEKLREIAKKLKLSGEKELSDKVIECAQYIEGLGPDKFPLIKEIEKNPQNILFWNIRSSIEDSENYRTAEDPERKADFLKWKKESLERIAALAKVNDISRVDQIIDEFDHYENSQALIDFGLKAFEKKQYGFSYTALKKAKDFRNLRKLGKVLLKQKNYSNADYFLKAAGGEGNASLVSKALKEDLLTAIRQDMPKGLDFLLNILRNEELKKHFNLETEQKQETLGHISVVSSLSLKTGKLLGDFNIAVKADEYRLTGSQSLDKEVMVYKKLRTNDLSMPKVLKLDKVDEFYVGVFEYLPGKLLIEQTINSDVVERVVKETKKIQRILATSLNPDEKTIFLEEGFGKDDFYSHKIAARFKEKMRIDLNEELLRPLDTYLLSEDVKKSRTVVTDRNPTNIIYNPKTGQLQMIDFNAARVSLPQEDWAFFIDDPRLKTSLTRDEMIQAYAENPQDTTTFHYIATYRNLIQTAMRWVDEPQDKQISYHNLQRAKESARKIGLTELVQEIEQKIEPMYKGL
ncbi:phosphotransferase [Candidatus Woesearchaeota archaeon]|nr:phosphotransferase [Candidatus Woesearchaeota archaeon]